MSYARVSEMLSNEGLVPYNDQAAAPSGVALAKTIAVLREENRTLRRRLRELEQTADADPLLPVQNRRAFIREIERAQSVKARYDIPSCIIYFDLNDFKQINDRYGHAIGDEMLLSVSAALLSGVRDCDVVARLGGDEFGVLLFKTDLQIASAKAAVLAMRLSDCEINIPTARISVSAAWGAAACKTDEAAEHVLSRADQAMYDNKNIPDFPIDDQAS
ncbi:GGDEF domain-containing protein [Robiginitomaculum antarcticum]|uniref:GGDEF domain-containing protein n=1 Tax=Robiginitomaculum antarcticum TaxID=437507 RepID=UPI00036801DC|nr:GGDEF domain-containing protein [Robiginitomaculum antarcticum]